MGKWPQRGVPVSTPPSKYCTKIKVLVLSYISFCTNLQTYWQKTCPDIRSPLFLCNKELHKKFAPILIVCQRWSHGEKTKPGITFDLDVILTCGFFKSHICWKCFSWENKLTCFFWIANFHLVPPQNVAKSTKIGNSLNFCIVQSTSSARFSNIDQLSLRANNCIFR